MIPKKVSLKEIKFESQYYVTGHFNFIFKVEYDDNDSEQEIIRRYNDIRSLYKTLKLKSPGCRIPDIPEKSIWLKINYGNQNQMKERQEGIMEFLTHLVEHKILRKNKYVIKFFSPNEKNFSYNDNLINKKGNDDNKEDSDDEFASNIIDIKNGKNEKGGINLDYLDENDIEPLEEFITEYNNRNKGLFSKGKKMAGDAIKFVKNLANNTGKKNEEGEEEKSIIENKDSTMNSFFMKKLTKDDYDFIKQKTKDLGEDYSVNDYNEKINTLNEGVNNIIQNLEKLNAARKKSLDALKEIVNKDKDIKKLSKKKIEDDFDMNEEKSKENDIDINHKRYIKKLSKYCTIQTGFLSTSVEETIHKVKKYQSLLKELLDIYARKSEHLNYLGRLHSQKDEMEKQRENDKFGNPMLKIKIEEMEKKLEHEIKFIKKLNKDLKYEIEIFKNNKQKDIYVYINNVYKEKINKMKDSLDYIYKEKLDDEEEQNIEQSNINDGNSNSNIKGKSDEKIDDDFL